MKVIDSMRRDWNERARKDAFLYIASWRHNWNEETFFASGESDYQHLVEPILAQLAITPAGSSMAELGCGAGRMTRAFARRFRSVAAIDISEEMQSRARGYLAEFANVRWVLSDGVTLAGVETSSVHFVFSYLVLQHYPSAELIAGSIQEMMRILRPGGGFLFQFNGSHRPTMNLRGRFVTAVLDGICSIGLRRFAKPCARLAGIDPEMIGKTWRGIALSSGEVDKMAREAGGLPSGFQGTDSPYAWCFGRKVPQENL
ncbi:MAG TPA: class I SAM-dependent methyltransferase [Candidatus Acidoferrum sp.]|jgi:SAM-dependent methyltransferase|nr:class I SAM-dependent methyltransferase [Candidatus Acidoferrum sp.]